MKTKRMLERLLNSNSIIDRSGVISYVNFELNEKDAAFFIMPWAALLELEEIRQTPTLDKIKRDISYLYEDTHEAFVISNSRKKEVREPRQIGHFLSRALTDKSLSEIGFSFGFRDHSTVLNSCKVIANDFETNARISETIHNLCSMQQVSISVVYDFIDEIRGEKRRRAS